MRKTPYTHDDLRRLDRAADNYLHDCYRKKKVARGKDFARSLELTPQYVSWLGKQILGGGSLHTFLREKQLAYAARLLKTTPLDVEEIALRCAFGSLSTMHRWFRKRFGMSPATFRGLKK